MGCGKTMLVKYCIADALGLPLRVISLGGSSDASFLNGHQYTYEGSTPGAVVDALRSAGCMNPVILFDELDKVSDTHRGQEIVNVLIHLTDATQNDAFSDNYLAEVPIDVSRALMVFTFNNIENVSPILRDRMVCIQTPGYTLRDKQIIAEKHVLPALCAQYGFRRDALGISAEVVAEVVAVVPHESGVRNLQRGLESVVAAINLQRLMMQPEAPSPEGTEQITSDMVRRHVHREPSGMKTSVEHMYI
jgi:ATP-dependent Lon protease